MKKECLAYAAGPGNVVNTFSEWQKGCDDDHQVAVTYSGQFFETCKTLDVRGVAFSSNPEAKLITTSQFHVENLPKPDWKSSFGYHWAQIKYVKTILKKVHEHSATTLIVSCATGHWFPFLIFAHASLRIIPSFHCTLWPQYLPKKWSDRCLQYLNRYFYKNRCHAMLCLSEDIHIQLNQSSPKELRPIFSFLPTYREKTFRGFPKAHWSKSFHILYAGRMEPNKGVLDILEIAVEIKNNHQHPIVIHVCGDGSLASTYQNIIDIMRLNGIVHFHGYCHRKRLLQIMEDCHASIVPTRRDMGEGFNKVVAESILAGRPVITSKVCPALAVVKAAAIEVEPEDISGYTRAIINLANNRALYQRKQDSCLPCGMPFLDQNQSWGYALSCAVRESC